MKAKTINEAEIQDLKFLRKEAIKKGEEVEVIGYLIDNQYYPIRYKGKNMILRKEDIEIEE